MTAVKDAITRRAEEIYETKKQEMVEQLDREKDELLAGITLKLMQHVSMETLGQTLRIELDTSSLNQKR